MTRQTNSRLKQPACEIKAPLLLSKRLVSAGSDKPNRPQPVKTVPVRESLKNNGGPSVPRMGVKAKTMLQKPKNGSTIDKASIQTKVVSKSQLPIKTESPILTPKRRSIATSTPSKSTRLDGVNSLESTPILSKKKNGTFIKEDNATANVVVNERKKRRSLIPTPSKKKVRRERNNLGQLEVYGVLDLQIQWNVSIVDIIGTAQSVLIQNVSSFQR